MTTSGGECGGDEGESENESANLRGMGDAAVHRFDFLSVGDGERARPRARIDLVSMGIVGTAVSNNPQKGYDQLLTAPEPPFRTAPDASRRSCLAHEGREISKSLGRTLSGLMQVATS